MHREDSFFQAQDFREHQTRFYHNVGLAAQSHQVSTNFDDTFDSMKTNQQLREEIAKLKNWISVLNERQLTKKQLFIEQKTLLIEKMRIYEEYEENLFHQTNLYSEILECFQKLNAYVVFHTKYYLEEAKRAHEQKQRKIIAQLKEKYKTAKERNQELKFLNKESVQERVQEPLKKIFTQELELLQKDNQRIEKQFQRKKKLNIIETIKEKYCIRPL